MKLTNQKVLPGLILLFHLLVLLLHHIFGNIGPYGYDDVHYSSLANDLLNGSLDYNDHFVFRTPIIVFTAISYFFLGITDFASSLPTLIVTSSILLIVYYFLRDEGTIALLTGLSLTTFSTWFILYSDKLMLDIYLALAITLALFILHKYKYKSKKQYTGLYAFAFSFALFFGFTAKETIVLMIPLLIYIFLMDVVKKQDLKFWGYSALFGSLILLVYFLIIRELTGSLTKRFEAIAANGYLNLCSYDKQSSRIVLNRVGYEFFNLITFQGIMTGFIFVIPVLFRYKISSIFNLKTSFSFFIVSSVVLLLSSNFMTISYTSYVPLCLDPRHYLFLLPVVSVPAAQVFKTFLDDKSNGVLIFIVASLITLLSYFLPGNSFWTIYLPITIMVAAYLLYKRSYGLKIIFAVILSVILLIKPIEWVVYSRNIRYDKQKEAIFENIIDREGKYYVITNEVQKRICDYYCKFDDSRLSFLEYNKFRFDTLNDRKLMLLHNWYTMYLSNLNYNDLPYYAKKYNEMNDLIFQDDELNMSICEIKNIASVASFDSIIFRTFNDFEREVPYWQIFEGEISDSLFYSSNKANKINKYSATFSYPLDSLVLERNDVVLITGSFFCYYDNKTTSKLVISVENEGNVYVWEGLEINKYLKAFSNWWPVKYEYELQAEKIRESSLLKIYLWNVDKRLAFIDDFEITIRKINF